MKHKFIFLRPIWQDCTRNSSVCHYYGKCDVNSRECVCQEGFIGDGASSCLPDR